MNIETPPLPPLSAIAPARNGLVWPAGLRAAWDTDVSDGAREVDAWKSPDLTTGADFSVRPLPQCTSRFRLDCVPVGLSWTPHLQGQNWDCEHGWSR